MSGRRVCLFSVLGMFALLALGFAVLFVRHQMRVFEYKRYRAWSEEVACTHTDHAPPPDFRKWRTEFGVNEPDSATPEGRAALDAERERLPTSKGRLQQLLGRFHAMLASDDETAEDTFLSDFLLVLDGFSRASCAELLRTIHWGVCGGEGLRNTVLARGPTRGVVVIERYYRVVCRMVDLIWTRGGEEFEAAEADHWTRVSLVKCRSWVHNLKWNEVEAAIDRCQENWKEFRCDSVDSNFCRAHLFWEERYNLYYRERVRRGETNWLRPLSAYYRHHLDLARRILKREPKWSPGVGHGLYDDLPKGEKPKW